MRLKLATAIAFAMVLSLFGTQAVAATIGSLNLLSDESGQSLSVGLDAPADYQVFDLEGPSRLVLSFPGAVLAEGINPVQGTGSVDKVFPTQDSDGVRLVIGLSQGVKYNITEQGNNLLVSFTSQAESMAKGKGAELADIQVRDQNGSTELILRGNRLDANYNALVTNQGKTMVLDFWGGESKLPKEYFSYTTRRVNAVTLGSAKGRLRLVVSLMPGAGDNHQILADVNQMIIRFGKAAAKAQTGSLLVEAVDFQPDERVAHLVIRTNDTNPSINLHEKDGNVIIDLKNAQLAEGQERSQDVRAFSGPVKQVDSYASNKDVRIVARLRQKAMVSSYQTGNVLTVTLKPEDMVSTQSGEEAARVGKTFSGQKVTFKYKDIDIRNALQLIAEMSELNIILSDDVEGKLTMRLIDVPWDQALDVILTSHGLAKEQMGNVIRIVPLEKMQIEQQARLQIQRGQEKLEPLISEHITLNFAVAETVASMLQGSQSTPEDSQAGASATTTGEVAASTTTLLSKRGSVYADARTNTLIIVDTQNSVKNIKRLVESLDKPVQQVLIEARIVEATDNFTRDFGIRWGGRVSKTGGTGMNFPSTVAIGSAAGATPTGSRGFVVDLPAAGAALSGGAMGVSLGSLSGIVNLDLELSASEANSDIKIVSSPRLVAANMMKAHIKQGTMVPIVTPGTVETPATTELVEAVMLLEITPQITSGKEILLKILITKDAPTTVGGLTGISKKEIDTSVLLKNGETIVIGGIYTREDNVADDGVPGLKDIPILGWLFKKNTKQDNRTELLIFLTPKVIEQTPIATANSD
jgi:type IV pilus assembly protein PilQ